MSLFVLAANPGPALHLAVLGALIFVGLVIVAAVRRRNRREAAEDEVQSSHADL
jgi:hypothetical protein